MRNLGFCSGSYSDLLPGSALIRDHTRQRTPGTPLLPTSKAGNAFPSPITQRGHPTRASRWLQEWRGSDGRCVRFVGSALRWHCPVINGDPKL